MNIKMNSSEMDTEHREEGSDLIEYIDGLNAEIGELKVRLQQIKAISKLSRLGLEATIECFCCEEGTFEGVLKSIESIAGNK